MHERGYITMCPDCNQELKVIPDFNFKHLNSAYTYATCGHCGAGHWWQRDGRRIVLADEFREQQMAEAIEDEIPE